VCCDKSSGEAIRQVISCLLTERSTTCAASSPLSASCLCLPLASAYLLPLSASCLCLPLASVCLLLSVSTAWLACCFISGLVVAWCIVSKLVVSCICYPLSCVCYLVFCIVCLVSSSIVLLSSSILLFLPSIVLLFRTQPFSMSCLCRVFVVLLCSDAQGCHEARGGDGAGGTASFQGPFATWRGRKRQDTAGQRDGYRGECHPFLS